MAKVLIRKIGKNAVVLLGIITAALGVLWTAGQFIELHPDAYGDLVKSILYGYGVYLLFVGGYHLLAPHKKRVKESQGKFLKGDRGMTKEGTGKKRGKPLEDICTAFLVITVINSIMMVNGWDTPKEGTFAYVHMLTRLLIITGIISVFMFKQVWTGFTNLRSSSAPLKKFFKDFADFSGQSRFVVIAKVFTVLTLVYCVGMIALQNRIPFSGGMFFYQSLLGLFVGVTLAIGLGPQKKIEGKTEGDGGI